MVEFYREYCLPTPDEAIENGCVSRLQRSWLHAAVFIAREHTKRRMGWDEFNRGTPKERGGEVYDRAAQQRVKRLFLHEYGKLCQLVRDGEVLTCSAAIKPYVPKPCEVKPIAKTGFNKPVSQEVAALYLQKIKESLGT